MEVAGVPRRLVSRGLTWSATRVPGRTLAITREGSRYAFLTDDGGIDLRTWDLAAWDSTFQVRIQHRRNAVEIANTNGRGKHHLEWYGTTTAVVLPSDFAFDGTDDLVLVAMLSQREVPAEVRALIACDRTNL
jgi:hypothetical protein